MWATNPYLSPTLPLMLCFSIQDQDQGEELTAFTITPHGIQARMPVFQIDELLFADLSWTVKDASELVRFRGYLVLRLSSSSLRPKRNVYSVLGKGVQSPGWETIPIKERVWREVLIMADTPSSALSAPSVPIPMNLYWSAPIRISARVHEHVTAATNVDSPWIDIPPSILTYDLLARGDTHDPADRRQVTFVIKLGRCSSGDRQGPLWANIGSPSDVNAVAHSHVCPDDHILEWLDLRRAFKLLLDDGFYTVWLQFAQCRWNPCDTLVLDDVDGIYHRRWTTRTPNGRLVFHEIHTTITKVL